MLYKIFSQKKYSIFLLLNLLLFVPRLNSITLIVLLPIYLFGFVIYTLINIKTKRTFTINTLLFLLTFQLISVSAKITNVTGFSPILNIAFYQYNRVNIIEALFVLINLVFIYLLKKPAR